MQTVKRPRKKRTFNENMKYCKLHKHDGYYGIHVLKVNEFNAKLLKSLTNKKQIIIGVIIKFVCNRKKLNSKYTNRKSMNVKKERNKT